MANPHATSPFVEEAALNRDSHRSSTSARKPRKFESIRSRFFRANLNNSSGMLSSNFGSDDMDVDRMTTTVTTADLDEQLMLDVAEDNILQPLSRVVSVSRPVFNYYHRKMRVLGVDTGTDVWLEGHPDPRSQNYRLSPFIKCLRFFARVIHPSSRFAQFWVAFIMVMDLLYSAFFVPISVAFCEIKTATYDWCSLVDLVAGGVYAVHLVMGFCIGYVLTRGNKQLTILAHRLLARFYILHGSFLVDFLSIAPWVYAVLDISGAFRDGVKYDYTRVLLVIRMLRIVRILPLLKTLLSSGYAPPDGISKMLPASSMYSIIMAYTAGVIVNFFACMMFTIAKFEGLENSWLARYDYANSAVVPPPNILPSNSKLRQYVLSVYWIVTTMTTVGYGDVVAVTVPEQVAMVVVMLSGVMVFGILVSSISESLSHASDQYRRAQLLRTKLSDIHHWLKNRQVDSASSRAILAWYSGAWKHDQELSREEDILDDLPWQIRRDVSCIINKGTLRSIRFFGIPPDPAEDASQGSRFRMAGLLTRVKAFGEKSVQKGLEFIAKASSQGNATLPLDPPSVPSTCPKSLPSTAHSSPQHLSRKDLSSSRSDQTQSLSRTSASQHIYRLRNNTRLDTVSADAIPQVPVAAPPDATIVLISPSDRQPVANAVDVGFGRIGDAKRTDKPPLHTRSLGARSVEVKDGGVPLFDLPPAAAATPGEATRRTHPSLWTQESNLAHNDRALTPERLLPFLASIMLSVEAMPLQDICTEGDVADSMWILEEGEVTVIKTARARFRKNEEEHDFWLSKKDPATETQEVTLRAAPDRPVLIGHGSLLRLDLLECTYCLHTIRARTFCQLWVIKMDVFGPMLKHNPRLEATLMNTLRDEMASHLRGFHHEAEPLYSWIDMCFFLRRAVRPEVCEAVADRLKEVSWDGQKAKLLAIMRCVARSSWKKNVEPINRLLKRQLSMLRAKSMPSLAPPTDRSSWFPPLSSRTSDTNSTSNSNNPSTHDTQYSGSSTNPSMHSTSGDAASARGIARSAANPSMHSTLDVTAANGDLRSADSTEGGMRGAPGEKLPTRGADAESTVCRGEKKPGEEDQKEEDNTITDDTITLQWQGEAPGIMSEKGGRAVHKKYVKKIVLKGIPKAFRKVKLGKMRDKQGSHGQHPPSQEEPTAGEIEIVEGTAALNVEQDARGGESLPSAGRRVPGVDGDIAHETEIGYRFVETGVPAGVVAQC